jgi:transcriptional regulator with PAS, ATPase and Fis domain
LLTFLDSRTFRRVGGTRAMTSNVRILAATNVELKQAAERGTFRRDLYYRLSVVPLVVPPLRERREDIPALARSVLNDLSRRTSYKGTELAPDVVLAFQRYHWPGNVRELRNALERALILSRGEPVALAHLPSEIRNADARSVPPPSPGTNSTALDALERDHILRVLAQVDGNRTRAAELLGISRSTLKRKLALLGHRDG